MIFIFKDKIYSGETAVEIIREIERTATDYEACRARVPDFLMWSLARLADVIPLRELEISPHLSDETNAFNYLCLLDNYGLGTLHQTCAAALPPDQSR
jgi:hypothetical protein